MISKYLIYILVLQFTWTSFAFAQIENSVYACPNFEFAKNLQKGDEDEDIFVLQQILNLDKRTMVAQTGPGSKGKETAFFGTATREAVKRFQALFIEYIEIADGKFNSKTRTVINSVCKGPFFTGEGKDLYPSATKTDFIAPIVGLSGPKAIDLETDQKVRVYMGASEAVKTPSLASLIIEGANASDLRKTSSTTYSFLITPNQNTKNKITIQIEAETIEDLAGNKNENASNEWTIVVNSKPEDDNIATTTNTDTSIIDDILNSIPLKNTSPTTDCSNVTSVDVYDYQNPCYGKAPMTGGQGETPEQQQQDGLGQMLSQLMQGLMQALKGSGGKDGGDSGMASMGDCSKAPTIDLFGKTGNIVGTYDMTLNPGAPGMQWVDNGILPPGPIYGEKLYPDPISCKKSCQGNCAGPCCNPQLDMLKRPVRGTIPAAPTHLWNI